MAHVADLHEPGHLLAVGPLLGPPERTFRGLAIFNVDVAQALRLKEQDPAVQAGRYTIMAMPWIVPAGAMSFPPVRLPRSMAEAEA